MIKYRVDYQPPEFLVITTFLNIDIRANETVVSIKLLIKPNKSLKSGQVFHLDGRDLELKSLKINGRILNNNEYLINSSGIDVHGIRGPCELEVTSTCRPDKNLSLEGLYQSGGMFCTQCEPEGFRRICFFPDRPDVMSIFTVRIEASEAFPQLLSNGNLVESGKCEDHRHYAIWHDPHPKPSYLFAAVIGDLDCLKDCYYTKSSRKVDLHIYVEKGNVGYTHHAMDSLKRSMSWDEEKFGLEYDLDLFQIVAVSHFNMGAMENKGLNIFNSKFVLADPITATDVDLNRVESIIAHEYFHNWTGNRVTCRDWFQLTLKEGLTVFRDQCFSSDVHDQGMQRTEDVSRLRSLQFPEDRSPNAHPIRPESYKEINNFYTATVYEKGAEVVRMIAGYLGEEGFRRGMDLYFSRHDGSAVTCDDFVTALADATETDLQIFMGWYEQAGTPILTVKRRPSSSQNALIIDFKQKIPSTAADTPRSPLPIPVRIGLIDPVGKEIPFRLTEHGCFAREHVILVTSETQCQKLHTEGKKIATPSLLRNFSAPIILEDDLSENERINLLKNDTDLFNRWDSAQRLLCQTILEIVSSTSLKSIECKITNLADAFSIILSDASILDQFKASLLTLPSLSFLERMLKPVDPVTLFEARCSLEAYIGRYLHLQISSIFSPKKLKDIARSAGGRALVNRLLALGVASGEETAITVAEQQVLDKNMTLSQGGLSALNNSKHPARGRAMKKFHDRWINNALVIEKWFMMEATSPYFGTVSQLEYLMGHTCFDPNNPNKVRAVLGAFMNGNPLQFYAEDGAGFNYAANCLIDIDKRNPQLAARMVLPLTRMENYHDHRKTMMRKALLKIQYSAHSNDLREVVDKALIV